MDESLEDAAFGSNARQIFRSLNVFSDSIAVEVCN